VTWLTPSIAIIAASIVIPALLILYFLKLRRRDQAISSTLLWKQAIQDFQANAPFQRLRKNILLLLQLIVLALILLAIAQPLINAQSSLGTRHVILIDRSASMSATDGEGGTRLDQAKKEALDLIDRLREPSLLDKLIGGSGPAETGGGAGGDKAMIVAFDETAEVVHPVTGDKAALRNAIRSISATGAASSVGDAYRLALAQAQPNIRITNDGEVLELPRTVGVVHLWTDGRLLDAEEVSPSGEDTVIYNKVGGSEVRNVGITSLRAERAFDDPSQLSIYAGLTSTIESETPVDVTLRVDGTVAGVRTITLTPAEAGAPEGIRLPEGESLIVEQPGAPGSGGAVFRLSEARGSTVEVSIAIDGEDQLPADDRGWLVVPPARKLTVALVTDDPQFFTADVIAALPLARLDQMTSAEYLEKESGLGAYDVTVFDRWLPLADGEGQSESGGDRLPAGGSLVLGAVPTSMGLRIVGESPPTLIADWTRRHPAMREITLDGVNISEMPIVDITGETSVRVLASAEAGPAIVDAQNAASRAIVLLFHPGDSDWPFRVSYPVFLASAIDALGSSESGGEVDLRGPRPGRAIAQRLPAGASNVRVTLPDGSSASPQPGPDGRIVFGPVREPGLATITWSGGASPTDIIEDGSPTRRLAVNLLDENETDARPAGAILFASTPALSDEQGKTSLPKRIWPWLLLGALGVMLLEWWVYNRRVVL